MRLHAAIRGDLKRHMADEVRAIRRALREALKEAGTGLRDDLCEHVAAADLGRLSKAWAHRQFARRGRRRVSDVMSVVYVKGRSANRAVEAFEYGSVVRPVNARYLAIPTHFNRKSGRRGAKVLFRPDQILNGFIRRSRKGTLILFAKTQRAQRKIRGRVRDQAYVNDRLLGSGRVRRTQAILEYGAVPMFILVPEVRIGKRLDIRRIAAGWMDRLPEITIRHMEIESDRQRT